MAHLFALQLLIVAMLCAYLALRIHQRRRAYELTYERGQEVSAHIFGRAESTATGFVSSEQHQLGDVSSVGHAAALILTSPWRLTITFTLGGAQHVSRRRISSRTFYRFKDKEAIPILVRPEAPEDWVPLLAAKDRR